MSKYKRKIFKKISPVIGNFLDSLFLTNFSRRGLDHYHKYHQNDYSFNKELYCVIHVPRTGGGSLNMYLSKNKKFYTINKGAQHYPVSFLCNPNEYKYISIIRDPISRTISHYNMLLKMKTKVASFGISNWFINDKLSRNLFCQYYSGHVFENVNEQIYKKALENLKKFYFVVDFNEFENEVKFLFNKLNINFGEKIKNYGSFIEKTYTEDLKNMKVLATEYNYWDLKLFDDFLKFKKNYSNEM